MEKAFDVWRSLGSASARKGVLGAIWVEHDTTTTFAGLNDATHSDSPDHGFLIIAKRGGGADPIINVASGKNITCNPDNHVPREWGWSVYLRDLRFAWPDRNDNNGLSLGNPGSQYDGVTLVNGGAAMSSSFKQAYVGGAVGLCGKSGIFASCPWLILDDTTIAANAFNHVNEQHQIYGSAGLSHFAFRRLTITGSTGGNDGARAVSCKKGYFADLSISAISNGGGAIFPGANNSGDPLGSDHLVERCVVSASDNALYINGANGVLARNVIVKGTTGSFAVFFGGHSGGPSSANGRMYNSVVYASTSTDVFTDQYSTTSQVKNCIFQRTSAGFFFDINTLANFTSDYNCFWKAGCDENTAGLFTFPGETTGSFNDWKNVSGQDAHSIFLDPLFTDAAGGDFTLQATSPCKTAGVALGEVPFDFNGVAHANPPSMGAFQSVASPPPDTTPPTVGLVAPLDGAVVSGVVVVTANTSDDTAVVGVQMKLDGVALDAEVTSAPFTITWDTTRSVDGLHSLTATARDAAGNSTTSTPISVTIKNAQAPTPPTLVVGAHSHLWRRARR